MVVGHTEVWASLAIWMRGGGWGALSVRLKAARNMLSLTGSWQQPHAMPHAATLMQTGEGQQLLGEVQGRPAFIPLHQHGQWSSGRRSEGCLLRIFVILSIQPSLYPPSVGTAEGRRDRATPFPDSEGSWGEAG